MPARQEQASKPRSPVETQHHTAFTLFLLLLALPAIITWQARGVFVMTASWYGTDFQGRQTASGEVYDMYSLTAAHKTLPLGSILKITCLKNGRTACVTVNDRGPYVRGRDLDLSYAAALQLGCINTGVMSVKAEWIGHDKRYSHHLSMLKVRPASSIQPEPAGSIPALPAKQSN